MPEVTPTPNVTPEPNKIETRINKLYGEKMEAQENASALTVENEYLRTQMLSLQEQVTTLQTPETTPVPTPKPQAGNNNAVGFDEAKLQGIIEASVGKVLQTSKDTAKKEQELRQAHVNSWGSAIDEMAELKDKQTDLYKTAQNIWDRDPELKSSPNGPYKAAVMARGIVGFEGKQAPNVQGVQQQAVINNNLNMGSDAANIAELDKQIATAKEQLSQPTGGNIGNAWMKYKDLQAQKGELLKKKD